MARSRIEAIFESILNNSDLPTPKTSGEVLLARIADAIKSNIPRIQVAKTATDMTNPVQIYVYIGSETGYVNGNWYYYDSAESEWKSGGVYQASLGIDSTLSESGMAADAAAVSAAIIAAQEVAISEMMLYLEGILLPTEDDFIANENIPDETFFMIQNGLYRATGAIAKGTTISTKINCERLSISDALNFLQSQSIT